MSLETIDFSRLKLKPNDLVLDLGCGEGRHAITAYLTANAHVIGLDLDATDLGTAKSRFSDFEESGNGEKQLDFIRGSGLRLPFANATFDKVICAEVLEHIHDYAAVIAEIRRVLKPGGVFACSVPRYGPEWVCWQLSDAYHEVEGGHVRIFRRAELRGAIEARDMICFGSHWAHALHVPYWWLKCLFWANADNSPIVKTYHRFLVWDLMQRPRITRWLETLLNPLMGKSTVMYFVRGNA
jgi:SAM-dependent methyltransferase